MTDMPHTLTPAAATLGILISSLRATVLRGVAQLSQPGLNVSHPDGREQAERLLDAACRREEARRAADRLLR